jgi:signal transduction histidine kinase/ActR/RegA family two-component response regulator
MSLNARVFTSTVARRTFALFVACALVPVSALAGLAFHQVTGQLHEQAQRRLHQASKTVAMVLLNRLLAADAALGTTADPRRAPVGGLPSPLLGVTLSSDDGTDRVRFGEMDRRPTFTPAQLASLHRGKPVLSIERDAGGPVRVVVSHALDRDHPTREILHGTIDPAFLWTLDDEAALPRETKLVVLDDAGRLLFSSFGTTHVLPEAVTRLARQRNAGQLEWRDSGNAYIATHRSLFLQASLTAPKWTIVLNESNAKVMAPMTAFTRMFLLVIVLTILTVLLLSFRQIRRSLTPVAQLKEGARRLALGDLDARVEVASRDEFAELATAFNTMASQLGRQFHTLAMRREISAALHPRQDVDELLDACAQALTRHLGLAVVGIWMPGTDRATLELRASARPAGCSGEAPRIPMSERELGRLVGQKIPYVNNALRQDPRRDDGSWAAQQGLVAFVAHPLVGDDRLMGVLGAFASHALDATDLSALAAAAGDMARCIDRKQVGDALHESEEQMRQLQKMEAVGRLAGGIAHDFNNLLLVITGRTYLLLEDLAVDDPRRKGVQTIDATAQRAALLTRQLLAFSRKQILAPTVLALNDVVSGLMDILHRLIGESIELVFRPGSNVGTCQLDRGQVEQVLVNLVVNARDAMPQGGRITIETSDIDLDEASDRQLAGAHRGPHVMLTVTDTGTGMDEHTRARIFEPFFTTKAVGKGTGLGLATVYGIIQQSGGRIQVESELGVGTTFTLYFPRVDEAVAATERIDEAPRPGTETVLVVDDESEVQTLLQAILVKYGYTVLGAERPTEAVRLAERHPGAIHLLLTDMVMPEMGGPALAQRLRELRPDMAVLYMSGYADYTPDADPGGQGDAMPTTLLQKPFTPEAVARAVRTALDAGRAAGAAIVA